MSMTEYDNATDMRERDGGVDKVPNAQEREP